MHTIQLVGQVITCTNYTTARIFDFNPVLVQKAAETFLLCGVAEIELPQGVLDPDDKYPETGLDGEAMRDTLGRLPPETSVIGTYLDARDLGADAGAYLRRQRRTLELLTERFPDLRYAMLHPGPKDLAATDHIRGMVETYARLAEHARGLRPDFQLCFHNHYDSNGETADQVRTYLQAIAAVDSPALRWGVDTAHAHGMQADYLSCAETTTPTWSATSSTSRAGFRPSINCTNRPPTGRTATYGATRPRSAPGSTAASSTSPTPKWRRRLRRRSPSSAARRGPPAAWCAAPWRSTSRASIRASKYCARPCT